MTSDKTNQSHKRRIKGNDVVLFICIYRLWMHSHCHLALFLRINSYTLWHWKANAIIEIYLQKIQIHIIKDHRRYLSYSIYIHFMLYRKRIQNFATIVPNEYLIDFFFYPLYFLLLLLICIIVTTSIYFNLLIKILDLTRSFIS